LQETGWDWESSGSVKYARPRKTNIARFLSILNLDVKKKRHESRRGTLWEKEKDQWGTNKFNIRLIQ
jgi:hypothetical protein